MVIRGLTQEQLNQAAKAVNGELREVNQVGRGFRFQLKPTSEKYRLIRYDGFTGKSRRVHAMCWHGFRDFFREVFAINPEAVAITARARYNGLSGFEQNYMATDGNIGSRMYPLQYSDACNCDS